jgi:hypothetical protein
VPAELLPLLFAVVLVVNALFVGLAIRSLWRSRDDEPRPPTWTSRPVHGDAIARSVRERAAPEPQARPEADTEARRSIATAAGVEGLGLPDPAPAHRPEATIDALTVPTTVPEPEIPVRTPRRRSAAVGGRRRFALPPLDEDHEKVRRSIETFLGGTGTPTAGAEPPDPASILTVAVIGLAGADELSAGHRSRRSREPHVADPAGPAELRAMLERTVRSTARGTDRVQVDRHGRVRVILTGTGELAAHAYLRRIRAFVEPIAEAAVPPTRVVVAAATDLDGSAASARRRADRRFAAALQGGGATSAGAVALLPEDPDAEFVPPRAAGD